MKASFRTAVIVRLQYLSSLMLSEQSIGSCSNLDFMTFSQLEQSSSSQMYQLQASERDFQECQGMECSSHSVCSLSSKGSTLSGSLSQDEKRDWRTNQSESAREYGLRGGLRLTDWIAGLEKHDFSFLRGREKDLVKKLNLLISNWSWLQIDHSQSLQTILDLLDAHLSLSQHSQIYPRVSEAVKKVESITGLKGDRRRANCGEHQSDELLVHIEKDVTGKSKRQEAYYIQASQDKKVPLSEYAATCAANLTPHWQQIYFQVQRTQFCGLEKQLEVEKVQESRCLGCSQFFYKGSDIFSTEGIKVQLIGKVSDITANSLNVRQQICAMLNSGGGILLLDCKLDYLAVRPVGQVLTQREKEQIQQKIYSYLTAIYPRPQVELHVTVSFVPVKENPSSPHLLSGERYLNKPGSHFMRPSIDGLYVTRIKICPTEGRTVYFWSHQERHAVILRKGSLLGGKARTELHGADMMKYIKQRHEEFAYECDSSLSEQEKFYLSRPFCDFDHLCRKPEEGELLSQRVADQIPQQSLENQYKYASIIIAWKDQYPSIQASFKRHGIACSIINPYENYGFKYGVKSAILYHDAKFEQILALVGSSKDFIFQRRPLIVILITEYIHLSARNEFNAVDGQYCRNLEEWLQKEHPSEQLSLWRYINDNRNCEYYLETQSRTSSFLLYLIITHFGEKALFRNPRGMEKLSIGEKAARFTKQYPIMTKPSTKR